MFAMVEFLVYFEVCDSINKFLMKYAVN